MWGGASSLYHFQGGPGSMHFRVTEVLVYTCPWAPSSSLPWAFWEGVLGICRDSVETPNLYLLYG